jgi:hypothetical protein
MVQQRDARPARRKGQAHGQDAADRAGADDHHVPEGIRLVRGGQTVSPARACGT